MILDLFFYVKVHRLLLIDLTQNIQKNPTSRAIQSMFDYLLKVLNQMDNDLDKSKSRVDEGQNLLISQVNSIDNHMMTAHILKHFLEPGVNRVLVVCFDDSFGPVHNLMKHIGCQPDQFVKSGALHHVRWD